MDSLKDSLVLDYVLTVIAGGLLGFYLYSISRKRMKLIGELVVDVKHEYSREFNELMFDFEIVSAANLFLDVLSVELFVKKLFFFTKIPFSRSFKLSDHKDRKQFDEFIFRKTNTFLEKNKPSHFKVKILYKNVLKEKTFLVKFCYSNNLYTPFKFKIIPKLDNNNLRYAIRKVSPHKFFFHQK